MEQNLISAEISAADALAVEQLLTQVKEKLPFLLTLSPEQRQYLTKSGNTYKPFIDKALEVINQYPQIFLELFDKEEFKRDADLVKTLEPILLKMKSLTDALEDTVTALKSDSMVAALEVYSNVQGNKAKVPGLNIVYDEMKVFFAKKRQTVKPEVKQ